MYRYFEPKPEGAIYPKRSTPQGESQLSSRHCQQYGKPTAGSETYKGGASRLLPSHTTGRTGPYHGGSIEFRGRRCDSPVAGLRVSRFARSDSVPS